MTLSPKDLFQKTDDKKPWTDLVAQPYFQRAVLAALNEMTMNLPRADSVASSWDAHSKIVGAREYLHTLLNLAEPMDKPRPQRTDNLNYKA